MVFNVEEIPEISEKDWRISITGEVEEPHFYSIEQLKQYFEPKKVNSNILCLRGVTIKGVWTGVDARELVDETNINEKASWVEVRAYSDYVEPVKLKDFVKEGVIIAYALNDKIIPVEQGGSLRLIVPQKYAYKSVKWLNELRLLFKRPFGFWEKKGYPFKDQ